jgi:hypothetical protein
MELVGFYAGNAELHVTLHPDAPHGALKCVIADEDHETVLIAIPAQELVQTNAIFFSGQDVHVSKTRHELRLDATYTTLVTTTLDMSSGFDVAHLPVPGKVVRVADSTDMRGLLFRHDSNGDTTEILFQSAQPGVVVTVDMDNVVIGTYRWVNVDAEPEFEVLDNDASSDRSVTPPASPTSPSALPSLRAFFMTGAPDCKNGAGTAAGSCQVQLSSASVPPTVYVPAPASPPPQPAGGVEESKLGETSGITEGDREDWYGQWTRGYQVRHQQDDPADDLLKELA